jgi:hypothetical protein
MEELQEQADMAAMLQQSSNSYSNNDYKNTAVSETKKEGMLRIGVYEPTGESQANNAALQQYIAATLKNALVDAVAISSEEEAIKYNCDYTLQSDFIRSKLAGKVGGFLKAIKNADPGAVASFAIELTQTLVKLKDGTMVLQPKINGKYAGKPDDAARKALEEGCNEILKGL